MLGLMQNFTAHVAVTEQLQPQYIQKLNNDDLCAALAVMREDGQSLPLMVLTSFISRRTAKDI